MKLRKSSFVQLISKGEDKYIIFNSYYGNLMKINQKTADLINYFEKMKDVDAYVEMYDPINHEQVYQIIKKCEKLKYLVPYDEKEEIKAIQEDKYLRYYPERLLRFYMTTECNMACTYCFEKNKVEHTELGEDDIINASRAFIELLKQEDGDYDLIKINFFGGEPLLKFGTIKKLLPTLKTLFDNFGKPYKFTINTNGILLNNEIIEWILQNKVHVYLSIDGLKEQHDANRIFKNGEGTFDIVIKKLDMLIKAASEEFLKKYLTILVTVNNENIYSARELAFYLKSLGVKNISLNAAFSCALSCDDTNWSILSEEKLDVFVKEVMKLRNELYPADVHIGGMWGYIPNRLQRGGLDFCQAVGHEIGITPDRFLYPCPCTCDNTDYAIGYLEGANFMFNEKYEKWKKRNSINIPNCNKCSIGGICRGGCPGTSILKGEDIYNPMQCEFWKKFVRVYLNNYVDYV